MRKFYLSYKGKYQMNIEKIMKSNTKIIGKTIQYQKEITSTHLVAKETANNSKNNGKIILAEKQTEGIGTKGRNWYTGENKNIAMSIILHPTVKPEKLAGLTTQIAISMQKTIEQLYGYKLAIKEPNDLLLKGKKICGILTEINTISEKINYLIISLGFNVNEEQFSEETKNLATSLKKEYGKDFNREDIIVKFIEILEQNIKIQIEL